MCKFTVMIIGFLVALSSPLCAVAQSASGPGGASGGGGGGGGGNGGSAELFKSEGLFPSGGAKADDFVTPTLFPPTIYGAVRLRDLGSGMLNPQTPVLVTDLDHSKPTYYDRWVAAHKFGGGFGGYEE